MNPSLSSATITSPTIIAPAVSPAWFLDRVFDNERGDDWETIGRMVGNVVGFGVMTTLVWVILHAFV
jgi:hypothetical protein